MRSLHCAGYPQGTSRLDLHTWFSQYGNIECLRICGSSLAFVCFENEANAEDAIRGLHNKKLDHGRKLRVEWAERECTRRHDSTPTKITRNRTLFVFNIDPKCDLKGYFQDYGTVLNVNICKDHDHAYVDFKYQKDATKALKAAHMSKLGDKVLKVDYKCYVSPQLQRKGVLPRPLHYNRYDNNSRARRSRSPGSRSPNYSRNDNNSRARRSSSPGSSRNDNNYRARRSRRPGSRSPHYSRNDNSRARISRSPGSRSPHYTRNDNSRARRSRSPGSRSPHYTKNDNSRARRSRSRSPNYSRYDSSRAQRSAGRYSFSSGRR